MCSARVLKAKNITRRAAPRRAVNPSPEQLAAGRKMRALDGEWFDLTVKNRELYAALHAAK